MNTTEIEAQRARVIAARSEVLIRVDRGGWAIRDEVDLAGAITRTMMRLATKRDPRLYYLRDVVDTYVNTCGDEWYSLGTADGFGFKSVKIVRTILFDTVREIFGEEQS